MDTVHVKLIAAVTGQRLLSELIEEHRARPTDLHETRDPLRGRPVPAGTHRRLAEAFGVDPGPRPPDGTHERVARTVVG